MPDAQDYLKVAAVGEVHQLTLNRPERLNALHQPFAESLLAYFESLRRNTAVRVVTITGAGRGFCSGADLKSVDPPDRLRDGPIGDWLLRDMIKAMRACPQPIIATVRGAASGGGLAIALAADVILASPTAAFHAPFINLGLSGAELGVSWRLQRMMGLSRARQMLMSGKPVDAQTALRTGLVSEVVPDDQLEATGLGLAQDMLRAAPDALRLTKRSLDLALETSSFDAAMEAEERAQMLMIQRHWPAHP